MDRNSTGPFVAWLGMGLVLLGCTSGCSALGLSCTSGSPLTKEAEAVLEQSRIPHGIARENAKTVLPPHRLQPGDTVLIEPVSLDRDLRLPADQTVLADGTIDLGPYGRIVLAGQDLEQAEALIEQQIDFQTREQLETCRQAGCEPKKSRGGIAETSRDCDSIAINVRLLEPVHRYYVLGEVNAPGAYPLSGFETVLDAIVAAGGLNSSANPCQILLSRPSEPCECRVTLPVCYREIVQLGNTASNYQLRPGDRIFVASRSCFDEMMFWRARQGCPRCEACNRACPHPEFSPAIDMSPVANTMISPGSTGWLKLSNAPASPDSMLEPASNSDSPTQQSPRRETLGDYLSPAEENSVGGAASDIDGELDFEPLETPARQ
ncbi:polysaccharide biosynthesis/export family protein [Allorhodopirellula heiligendammensis]|uniref:SLBB domain protein n=1 Tax=Allorhodopirellula heiligendammensis TaxID=2714739 RepID=A0A5C6BWP3_9BACT|nr:SLBB domain-containing protein [Allorhodopirellula heiligendammensis]TWU15099.1 SLBB domain protein [Allorhodopirellula heiligendammensis]